MLNKCQLSLLSNGTKDTGDTVRDEKGEKIKI